MRTAGPSPSPLPRRTAAMPRVMKSKGRIAVTAAAVIALAVFGGVVLAMTWSHLA